MVRSGRDCEYIEQFKSNNIVAMRWSETGDIANLSRNQIA